MRPPVIAASAPGISSIGARSPWWSGVLRTRLHLVHQWAHAFSASDCKNDQPGQGARHLQTASCTDQSGHSGPSERRSGYSNQLAYDPSPPASHETVVRSSETASLATGGKEPACMCQACACSSFVMQASTPEVLQITRSAGGIASRASDLIELRFVCR